MKSESLASPESFLDSSLCKIDKHPHSTFFNTMGMHVYSWQLLVAENPNVPVANVTNAGNASFVFSSDAFTHFGSLEDKMKTFGELMFDTFYVGLKGLEMAAKPEPTQEQRMAKAQELIGSEEHMMAKAREEWPFVPSIETVMASEDKPELEAWCAQASVKVKRTIQTMKPALAAKLSDLRLTAEYDAATSYATALENVAANGVHIDVPTMIDTQPNWRFSLKVYMPMVPSANAKGPEVNGKLVDLVWHEGAGEPNASIKISQRMADIMSYQQGNHTKGAAFRERSQLFLFAFERIHVFVTNQ